MADVSKLRSFLRHTSGGRSGTTAEATAAPVASSPPVRFDSGRDAISVNGASVNDIQNLVDLVPPPSQGPPVWAANRATWNAALRTLGLTNVGGDEAVYEAAAFTYHSMGGELVTAEDNEEEVEIPEGYEPQSASQNAVTSSAPAPLFEGAIDDEDEEIDDGLDGEIALADAGVGGFPAPADTELDEFEDEDEE